MVTNQGRKSPMTAPPILRTQTTQIKKFKAISDYNNKLKFNSLPNEIALFEKDTLLKQKRDRWHEDLQKDLYIEETLNVIAEIRASQNGKGLPKKLSIN
jgi:carboxyl-terminal processing protease